MGLNVDGTALAVVRPGFATNSDSSLSAASCHSFSSSSSDLATAEASLQQRSRSSQVPLPSVLQPTCRPSEASTCREIVGPPTRCPRRCPGPWQSRGRRRFGLVFVGRVGADSISFVFIFRVCRRIQKAPTSFPVGQQLSRCDGRREGFVNLSWKFGKKTNGRRFDAP